jgi:hypothetical protein
MFSLLFSSLIFPSVPLCLCFLPCMIYFFTFIIFHLPLFLSSFPPLYFSATSYSYFCFHYIPILLFFSLLFCVLCYEYFILLLCVLMLSFISFFVDFSCPLDYFIAPRVVLHYYFPSPCFYYFSFHPSLSVLFAVSFHHFSLSSVVLFVFIRLLFIFVWFFFPFSYNFYYFFPDYLF